MNRQNRRGLRVVFALALVLLGGCRLVISTDESGQIISASGLLDCNSEECAFDIPHPVLVQGQAPKQALLTRFRAAGDAVLFATMSFWEGVDVPGDALRLVIVDKLPFGVPTDPLVAARCDALRDKGVQPFMKYLVPSAALTLKQGFGRLIRSKRDRGVVALLDGRVTQKGYGKAFLRALPPATRCTTLDEVQAAIDAQRRQDESDEGEAPC